MASTVSSRDSAHKLKGCCFPLVGVLLRLLPLAGRGGEGRERRGGVAGGWRSGRGSTYALPHRRGGERSLTESFMEKLLEASPCSNTRRLLRRCGRAPPILLSAGHGGEEEEKGVAATASMDALKNRARAFAEGIMIMVCPVLLAIAFGQVNLKTEGNRFIRGSISPVAAVTLEAGIIPFLCLCASKHLVDFSPKLSRCLFGASKLLIHLCALLQMALACGILLLISMKNLLYLLFLIPFVALTSWRCYWSVKNGPMIDETRYRGCEDALERSVDFSAAVTAILFLGLEGLAMEGHSNGAEGLELLLVVSLGVSFITCVVGVFIMLLGTVPPLIADDGDGTNMCRVVEILNVVLAIAMTVFLMASASLKELAWLVFIPPLVSFMVWLFLILDGDGQSGRGQVKPASMELTKVTFERTGTS